MSYPLDLPRRRYRRKPWWHRALVILIAIPVAFVADALITFAAMWVLTQFDVDAPFWPTFAGVLLLGLITGGGSKR